MLLARTIVKVIFKRKLSDWRFIFLVGLIVLAPLSKYPSFAIPLFNFPSFRIGLYQVLSLTFVLLCAKPVYSGGKQFFLSVNRMVFIAVILFGITAFTSIAWSLYPARSLLLAGSIVLLLLTVVCAWWFVAAQLSRKKRDALIQYMLAAAALYSILAVIQLTIFTFTNQTLGTLCTGCTAAVFGFPRINGFAAEPQFLANALLPFVFAALYVLFTKPTKLAWVALIGTVFSIGLTFSRGALFALFIALAAIAICLYIYKLARPLRIIAMYAAIFISLCASFFMLIGSASIRYANTPHIAYETLDSILEHLTVGMVNLPESVANQQTPVPTSTSLDTATTAQDSTADNTFVSPGLIESSGNERLGAAKLALQAWNHSPLTALLGVGAGNLGPFVVANIDANAPSNLTVYIYYVLLLAELGIVGLGLFIVMFAVVMYKLLRMHSHGSILLFGLLLAFLLQFLFFGSYINAMYVWLWLGVALGIASNNKVMKPQSKGV